MSRFVRHTPSHVGGGMSFHIRCVPGRKMRAWKAQSVGACSICGEPINPGDPISWTRRVHCPSALEAAAQELWEASSAVWAVMGWNDAPPPLMHRFEAALNAYAVAVKESTHV